MRDFRVQTTTSLEAAAAYAADDVLSNSDTNGAGVVWTFSNIVPGTAGHGWIEKAIVESESESITPRLTLMLFTVGTADLNCELDDNAASTCPNPSDKAYFVGAIDFPAMTDHGDDSFSVSSPSTYGNLPLKFESLDGNLYGVLVTRDAFTQTATDDMTITLEGKSW